MFMSNTGTISRGIRAPIVRPGDPLVDIVVKSVLEATEADDFELHDRDVVAVTEALVARAQSNFATLDQTGQDICSKFPGDTLGIVFPIMSRNRFAFLLRAFARVKKVIIQLSYPADEVGNPLITWDQIDQSGIDPYRDVLTEKQFHDLFGAPKHPFTGVNYIEYYKSLGDNVDVIFANSPGAMAAYTNQALACDIHTSARTIRKLKEAGLLTYGLKDIMAQPINGSGFNPEFGLMGSNISTDESVKLFPRDGNTFVHAVQDELTKQTGKVLEVMIYGDGAFKDPVAGIWELADPMVSPASTEGLQGQPNELKFKYLVDNELAGMSTADAEEAVKERIRQKDEAAIDDMSKQGTTPRRLTDLLGTLSDLTSGSGDKGTPIVLIQRYFENFASEGAGSATQSRPTRQRLERVV